MQQTPTNFFEWTQKYSTQEVCLEELSRGRWKDGFICPKCGHDRSYQLKYLHLHECAKCGRQDSPTAGTVFEYTRLPLPKWFAVIYLMGADKGGISPQRLSKMMCVSWLTAYRMFEDFAPMHGGRDHGYWFEGLVEVDDAFVGGAERKRHGFHGGSSGGAGEFESGSGICEAHFTAFRNLYELALARRGTSPEEAFETQEYIDEFVFRFNCRFMLPLIQLRCMVNNGPKMQNS